MSPWRHTSMARRLATSWFLLSAVAVAQVQEYEQVIPDEGPFGLEYSSSTGMGAVPVGSTILEGADGKGEWTVRARMSTTRGRGLRDGTDGLSTAQVFALGHGIAPKELEVTSVDIGASYGLSRRWSIAAEIPYLYKELDLDKTDKLLLMMLVAHGAQVSDRIENAADRISILAIKRRMS